MPDTTRHPDNDALVLLYYGELAAADEPAVRAHIDECGECRAVWQDLIAVLDAVRDEPAPDPGPDFEQRVWARLAPHLPRRRRATRTWMVAVAASLAAVLAGGWWFATRSAESPSTVPVAADVGLDDGFRERVLLTAVDTHLEQTEMLLVELLHAPPGDDSDIGYVRTLAGDLIASGRLYRTTAQDAGDHMIGGVLEDIETILLDVARADDDQAAAAALAHARERIERDDLLFRVRATALDIEDRQSRTIPGGGTL